MPSLPPPSYALHPDEKISHGFFRVLGELCAHAKDLMRSRKSASELVHDARVLIKRTRALLWFGRPALDKTAYARAKSELRKAAQMLSGQRDLDVTQSTLKALVLKSSNRSKRAALNATLKLMEAKPASSTKALDSSRSKLENAMKTPIGQGI